MQKRKQKHKVGKNTKKSKLKLQATKEEEKKR